MLKYDRATKTFEKLDGVTLKEAQVLERADLQACIMSSSAAFFSEIGEELFIVGEEVLPSETVQDRIDILAVDTEGRLVVVELKRGSNKLQLFQALSYAGMVARWEHEELRRHVGLNRWQELLDFIEVEEDDLNAAQRVLLVAEAFDYALLVGAEWLNETHGVDIRCCRVELAVDRSSSSEYLACTSVFPPPELAEQAATRGRRRTSPISGARFGEWDDVLASIKWQALRRFVEKELQEGRESYLDRAGLFFRAENKRRWNVYARPEYAYVWQIGRFEGDEAFWSEKLSDPGSVKVVKRGTALRFKLCQDDDLDRFQDAASTGESMEWS